MHSTELEGCGYTLNNSNSCWSFGLVCVIIFCFFVFTCIPWLYCSPLWETFWFLQNTLFYTPLNLFCKLLLILIHLFLSLNVHVSAYVSVSVSDLSLSLYMTLSLSLSLPVSLSVYLFVYPSVHLYISLIHSFSPSHTIWWCLHTVA